MRTNRIKIVAGLVFFAILGLMVGGNSTPFAQSRDTAPAGIISNDEKSRFFQPLDADVEKSRFLELINEYRSQNGLPVLDLDSNLQAAAQWLSEDMADKNYFSHIDSLGRDLLQRLADFGYTVATTKGENIAAGYATAENVLTGWKNSPGHNANMLNVGYHVIGIGLAYASASDYGWYWTTDFGGMQTAPVVYPTPTSSVPQSAIAEGEPLAAYPCPARDHVYFIWRESIVGPKRIRVYNLAGEKIAALQTSSPGQNSLLWDTRNVAAGIYLYRLEVMSQNAWRYVAVQKLAIKK